MRRKTGVRPSFRTFAVTAAISVLAQAGILPAEAKSETWPCNWVHGRMTAGNGTLSTRIWLVGTHRMLGVVNPGHPDFDVGQMPDSVLKLLTPDHDFTIWGDFYGCPVAPERPGWMRFVVVRGARKLVPRSRSERPLPPFSAIANVRSSAIWADIRVRV